MNSFDRLSGLRADDPVIDNMISFAKKKANKFQWYKDNVNRLDIEFRSMGREYGGTVTMPTEFENMKVNYDLFNNILDLRAFEYVCKPYGALQGELPARMVNRDIMSGKLKSVIGMGANRPYIWKAVAENPEATTRREQEKFGRIKQYVIDQIMMPIQQMVMQKHEEEMKGRQLSDQEQQQLMEKIQAEIKSQTPEEVNKYMAREHQDPAEMMANQLLNYLHKKCDLQRKFDDVLKHEVIAGKGVGYVGIFNGEPEFWVINPMNFYHEKATDSQFIQDGDRACCQYFFSPAQVVSMFGEQLTEGEIERIYRAVNYGRAQDDMFNSYDIQSQNNKISCIHGVWKSLKEIGFLTYVDPDTGEILEMIVDENYKLSKETGDIRIEWEWIPEVYETWKIHVAEPIYVNMQPIPGQFKDINNLHYCKIPYHGVVVDNMNSVPTSLADRLKPYQYYYNIIQYRIEQLVAADKGKLLLYNVNAIPKSKKDDLKKWLYYKDAANIVFFNPSQEGSLSQDANSVAKSIDLSMSSDLQKYLELANNISIQAGKAVGIPDAIEGSIDTHSAVANTQKTFEQSSNLLKPYYDLHDYFKRDVLQSLLECAKVAYQGTAEKKLSYVLDDLSIQTLSVDVSLLDNTTLGIFISNSNKIVEIKNTLNQLAQSAMQNQMAELSDVIAILRDDDLRTSEERLRLAETKRKQREEEMQASQQQAAAEAADRQHQHEIEMHEREKELVVLKAEEDRKTEIIKVSLLGASFNPDQDKDGDKVNDYFEIARDGLKAKIEGDKVGVEMAKLQHQKNVDKKKLEQEDKRIDNEKEKIQVDRIKKKSK